MSYTKTGRLLQVCSDLHLEHEDIVESNFPDIIRPCAEILVLAGDIGDPFSEIFERFITYCSKHFTFVLFVSGNHEYYNHTILQADQCIERLFSYFTNVIYLNNRSFEYEGITFVGSTLWSSISGAGDKQSEIFISCKYHSISGFTPEQCNTKFDTNLEFIKNIISKKENVVVITHHAPSYKCISDEFIGSKLNVIFATHLDDLLEHPNLIGWIYGHTHHNYIHYSDRRFLYANCYRTDTYNNSGVVL